MFQKSPADRYHADIERLQKAEKHHREALDALDAALQARQAAQVTPLRLACQKSESALLEALQAATDAHRLYWSVRRLALIPELWATAQLMRKYDAICRAGGDMTAHPARTMIESRETSPEDIVDADGVPTEAPDCALLDDYRGSWR